VLFLEGATLNVPEFVVISNPGDYGEGPWLVLVNGYTVYLGAEPFELSVMVIKSWVPTFYLDLGVVHYLTVFPVYGEGILAIIAYLNFFEYYVGFYADFEEL